MCVRMRVSHYATDASELATVSPVLQLAPASPVLWMCIGKVTHGAQMQPNDDKSLFHCISVSSAHCRRRSETFTRSLENESRSPMAMSSAHCPCSMQLQAQKALSPP